jgi:glycosyltransferase involved in cell wall biosynthesis
LARKVVGRTRVRVVENAISLDDISPSINSVVDGVRIVSAGRLCYQKAPWRFKSLAVSLLQENAHFAWIGGGDDRLLFKDDLGVPDNLKVTGWLERKIVLKEMQKANIFVLTSLWEGMPLALIEAQAIGLPSVVWDVVGSRDVVLDGVTGFVCNNELDFIEKTRLLILDSNLRLRMGKAGREMALNRFSSKKMHCNMLDIYGISEDVKNIGNYPCQV